MNRFFLVLALGCAALLLAAFVVGPITAGADPAGRRPGVAGAIVAAAMAACLLWHGVVVVVLRRSAGRIRAIDRAGGLGGRFEARAARNRARAAPVIAGGVLLLIVAGALALAAPADSRGPSWRLGRLAACSIAVGYHLAALPVALVAVAGQRALRIAAEAEAASAGGAGGRRLADLPGPG